MVFVTCGHKELIHSTKKELDYTHTDASVLWEKPCSYVLLGS